MLKDSSRIVLTWTKSIYPFSSVDRKHILGWKSVNIVFKFSCMRRAERCLFFTILDLKSDKKKSVYHRIWKFYSSLNQCQQHLVQIMGSWYEKKEIAQCKFSKEKKGGKKGLKKNTEKSTKDLFQLPQPGGNCQLIRPINILDHDIAWFTLRVSHTKMDPNTRLKGGTK